MSCSWGTWEAGVGVNLGWERVGEEKEGKTRVGEEKEEKERVGGEMVAAVVMEMGDACPCLCPSPCLGE